MSLDLTGAALVDFNFERVSVVRARFNKATFQGDTQFGGATFQKSVGFSGPRHAAPRRTGGGD
jgi:uncharacterized protein YjbI with pentapeptide repeats